MNAIFWLNIAAKTASKFISKQRGQFFLAAIGIRGDGSLVKSTNKATRAKATCAEKIFSTHAEARLCKTLGLGATVFVARVNRQEEWAMAKPCKRCETYLRNKKISKLYYTISPNEYGVLIF